MSGDQPRDEFVDAMRAELSRVVRDEGPRRRRRRVQAGAAVLVATAAAVALVIALQPPSAPSSSVQAGTPASPSVSEAPSPSTTPPTEPAPDPAEPEPPRQFPLDVPAGTPIAVGFDGAGPDAMAGGGPPVIELLDIYVECGGSGQVLEQGFVLFDCDVDPVGTVHVRLNYGVREGEGVTITTSADFAGSYREVPAGTWPIDGEPSPGTASVFVECAPEITTVTVGGVVFDCTSYNVGTTLGAWGIARAAGELVPRPMAPGGPYVDGIRIVPE